MKRQIKCASENYPEGLVVQTLQEAYDMDSGGMGDIWDDIEEYAQEMFGLPASKIKKIYGLYDGDNVDSGIETTNGDFYIAYSGHGVHKVPSKQAMLKHFTYDYV